MPLSYSHTHICFYDPSCVSHYSQVTAIFNEQAYWLSDPVYFPVTSTFDYFHHGAPCVRDAFGPGQDLDLGTLYTKVCVVDSKVEGFISYSYRIKDNQPTGYIALLAVKNELQGYGIGRQLLQAALQHLAELDVSSVYLWTRPDSVGNARALNFYKKMGFYEDGTWCPDDRPDDYRYMWIKMRYTIS